MNKKVLFAAFAVVFAALSCSKEAEPIDNTQEPEAIVPQQRELVPYTIMAGAPTKTAIDGSGNVVWSEDDAIKVYYDGGSAVSSEIELASGGASATFTVMLPEGMASSDKLYAVYPATTDASLSGSTFSIVVPEKQTGKFEDVNIVVAATTVGEHTLSFKQVLSFVNFTVSAGNPKAITRAFFKDLYETAIVGTLPVTFDDSGNATPGTATSTGTEVSLTSVQEGKNYMAVLPGVALQSIGLKLGSSSAWFTPICSNNDVTIEPGHSKPLGTVDTKVSDAFYVKESASGTGDGTSWANAAGGASALAGLVHTGGYDGYPRKAAMFRLPGFSIKLAAGTYAPEAITLQFGHDDGTVDGYVTIEGGFDADGTANSSAKATISGSNGHRILAVSNGVGLTLKELIFTEGYLTSSEGAAIRASSSTLVIEDCVFSSNVSAADGGALYYNTWGHSNYALTITGTTFGGEESSDANQAKAGSAIWLVQSNSASISNCIFKNNNATTLHDPQFGTVAITGNAQGVSIADCQFLSNTGGAIDVSSTTTSGYVAINDCRFEGNKTSYRGASIWVPGLLPVYVNNCVFKNEKGAYRGISIALDSYTSGKSGKMGINNCTFDHGSINTEGGNGTYESSDKLVSWIGEVWLSGKSILSNSTIIGEGVHGSLNHYYGAYGNPSGSVIVNNVITTEDMKDYVWRLSGTSFTVEGYYNVYSGVWSKWINDHDNSDIRCDSSEKNYWTSYWSPVADANGHYDYSIPTGKTVTKIPSLAEVRSAIATHEFGSSFITWLDSVDGLTKDASGTPRTDANNRQGALAK
ncbi:MAG: hypothetical protein IJQ61_07700 [Bacteroidales bacterium]|nr:hypothetical protein [Bacteroidales bacterium]